MTKGKPSPGQKCGVVKGSVATALSAVLMCQPVLASSGQPDRTVLPIRPEPFAGVIGDTIEKSKPSWPAPVTAPSGAPNVLLVMTDDVGFGASSAFGGPVPTPNLARVANTGLRCTNFHTTGVCLPTRAALLTGRNHHAVGAGQLADTATGFPGYNSAIPKSAATIGRVLTGNGYATAFYGKHHNVPAQETSAAGPFDHWPTGLGFEHFLGFIGGDTHQFSPHIYRNTRRVDEDTATAHHVDKAMADDAISWIRNVKSAKPDKPVFLYLATGAGHAPYHAPPEWLARFRGKFDHGWDAMREETLGRQKAAGIVPKGTKLPARPDEIPAWVSLSEGMKRVNARFMEAFAAHVSYQDAQFGRLVDELERMGQLDNTLIVFLQGDNGGTAQNGARPSENEIGSAANSQDESEEQFLSRLDLVGGPETYGVVSAGWGFAMNTPMPWFKHVASHLGATRNGLVVAWPDRIAAHGELRHNFAHVTDIMPTILAAAGVSAPASVDGIDQQRTDGASLVATFTDAKAATRDTQYFELDGNRAIYHRGWIASTSPDHMPWQRSHRADSHLPEWRELYDLRKDPSQSVNLASRYPEKLKELEALWDREARANNVYPLDVRPNIVRTLSDPSGPRVKNMRPSATFWGKGVSVIESAAPPVGADSFSVTASFSTEEADTTGVLLAGGSKFGGWSFYLKDGRPIAFLAASQLPQDQFRIAADTRLGAGKHEVTFAFQRKGGPLSGGTITIAVDGQQVAQGRAEKLLNVLAGLGETWDVGRDTGVRVSEEAVAGEFPGEIDRVRMMLTGAPSRTGAPQ